MLLSDTDILNAARSGELRITPFDRTQLQPASYDLIVGDEAATRDGALNVRERGYVRVARGFTAVIATRETLALGKQLAGHYGLRSKFAREGLVLLSGPQVDPGFEGILTVTVFNSGVEDITLLWGEHFATIEFVYLRTQASAPYSGPYQGQSRISPEEKSRLSQSKAKSFSEIEHTLDRLRTQIDVIFSVVIQVLVGVILGGVAGGVIGFLIAQALD